MSGATPQGDVHKSGDEASMQGEVGTSHSDALVFFGATGDLAHKKVFPALQAMAKRGHLNVLCGWRLP